MRYNSILFVLLAFLTVSCGEDKKKPAFYDSGLDTETDSIEAEETSRDYDEMSNSDIISVPFKEKGGVKYVNVSVNGFGFEMIFDTGASSTTISLQEAQYLAKHGKLEEDDILGVQKFGTADGKTSEGLIIKLKELVIGNKITVSNTYATVVMNQEAPLLLGGSVFTQFREVSVDREEHIVKFYKY